MDYYYSRSYFFRHAKAYLRLDENQSVSRKNSKLELRLIEETQDNNWPLLEWGVLGLSPAGRFLTYLLDLSGDSVTLALKHSVVDSKADTASLAFKLDAYLNPIPSKHYKVEDILGPFQMEPNSKWWVLEGSVALGDSELGYKHKKFCVDSFTNAYFGVVEALVWCQRIRNQVCPSSEKCSKTNANFDNAPKIQLIIHGHDLSLSHEDYIYFDQEGMQCRIGDTPASLEHQTCPPGTQVVLGKLFFEKFTPIFTLTPDHAFISLAKRFKVPPSGYSIWIVFGSLMVAVVTVGVVYVVVKKNTLSNQDQYEAV